MNRTSLELGAATLADDKYFKDVCEKIIATRERIKPQLAELGFIFPDSSSNFIFAKHKNVSGKKIFEELRKRGIIVRRWDLPRISEYLRITVGTDEQMDTLIESLRVIV